MITKSDLSPSENDWFSQFYSPVRQFGAKVADFFAPSSESSTTNENYEISVELPGVSDDEITVEIHDGQLTVTGEKRSQQEEKGKNYYFSERVYGSFQRHFRFPDDANLEKVEVNQKDGVLTIKIAKLKPKPANPKKIAIQRND
jgi:HSP20 family protein